MESRGGSCSGSSRGYVLVQARIGISGLTIMVRSERVP
jgi:hypothetical protein